MMGNRGGAIHNEKREIVRQYKSRSWIACVLEFKGRKRTVMSPGRYTELFFLDEAAAFAAGHRPCAECRRERFNAFKAAWKRWSQRDDSKPLLVHEIDIELHRARIGVKREKVTYEALLDSLPDGCFVCIDWSSYLVLDRSLFLWLPEGYVKKSHRPPGLTVTVLTPQPFVECFREGYKPGIHQSALEL
jgi:hypothetical protein